MQVMHSMVLAENIVSLCSAEHVCYKNKTYYKTQKRAGFLDKVIKLDLDLGA
jgi:hypothetical protein